MHDLVNEGARVEIANLKKTIKRQRKAIRKAKYLLSTIRIEADRTTALLNCSEDDEDINPM